MPVSELIRGLAGAMTALLATIVLAHSLAETRELLGKTEKGIQWVTRHSHTAYFAPLWQPILAFGATSGVCGYLMGVRLTSRRSIRFALVGAVTGIVILTLIPSPLPEKYGRAGENTCAFLDLTAVFLGGCVGTLLEERWTRRRDRFE